MDEAIGSQVVTTLDKPIESPPTPSRKDLLNSDEDEGLEVDPISRQRLSSSDETGVRIKSQLYHVPTLLDYLSSAEAEHRRDPVSRSPFTLLELQAIDEKATRLGLRLRASSLCSSIGDEDEIEASAKVRRKSISEEVLTLEALIGELISELAELVEEDQPPPTRLPNTNAVSVFAALTTLAGSELQGDSQQQDEESEDYSPVDLQLSVSLLLSQLQGPFALLKGLNLETAYFSLCNHKAYLRGNPKRPRVDGQSRCLSTIIRWLDSLWTREDAQKLKSLRGL